MNFLKIRRITYASRSSGQFLFFKNDDIYTIYYVSQGDENRIEAQCGHGGHEVTIHGTFIGLVFDMIYMNKQR